MPQDYPLPRFHFQVDWGGAKISFTEITGLVMEREKIEYRHSDSKDFNKIKMPGETHNGIDHELEIQQMSFSSPDSNDSKPTKSNDVRPFKKPKNVVAVSKSGTDPDTDPELNPKTPSKPKPKSFWSLR